MEEEEANRLKTDQINQRHPHQYGGKINYKQAVLSTLAFFDLFEYPLTKEETIQYLFKIQPDLHHVELTLNESNLIRHRGNYFQLAHDHDYIRIRHEREIISREYWKKIDKYRKLLAMTPYIQFVGVCNTLAYNNANENSDIDLFIVVKPGRLFLSRIILTFWMQIFGVRRHGNKIAGRFCLSFFTTSDNLNLESLRKGPLDIYLAYWVKTLKPIYGDPKIYHGLLEINEPWLKSMFAAPTQPQTDQLKPGSKKAERFKKWCEKMLDKRWGRKLEVKLGQWQLKRAREKRSALGIDEQDTAIIIRRDILKFHNVDKREVIYTEWIKKLQSMLKH
ncbi:MAG: hypothetical protein Q8P27_02350 [Candidatus Peregrinibacteria bacterium]|nr:hypothetical protein [Candidatus Peregrinibacteria bacterium]